MLHRISQGFNRELQDLVLKLKLFSSLETMCALVLMGSVHSVEVLCSLIRSIRSPLVDEIESNGEISKVMALLNSHDLQLQVLALECVFEIGYFRRKEAMDAMVKAMLRASPPIQAQLEPRGLGYRAEELVISAQVFV
ncbi:hypothetical protein VNO80_16003 [Phaseolus coccineus]|uniref:Uncharacterized protein n=1 Tax=Phaseolus coccineus TaxID=3886 RepID=A0AAN9MQV9_PHACN